MDSSMDGLTADGLMAEGVDRWAHTPVSLQVLVGFVEVGV
jgi:hypothetical protein